MTSPSSTATADPARTAVTAVVGAQAESTLVLVGNANVGKSVVFGALTGRYVTVSNFPGTTVEVASGSARRDGASFEVLDTPGTNGLVPLSEDEAVTRDVLLERPGARVLQVADSKNLRRALLLTAQLVEGGCKVGLCLNMADEAEARGIAVDAAGLSHLLGVPVARAVAVRGEGLEALPGVASEARNSSLRVVYPDPIEEALVVAEPLMPPLALSARALALMCLASSEEEDPTLWARVRRHVAPRDVARLLALRDETQRRLGEPTRYSLARTRLGWVESVLAQVERHAQSEPAASWGKRLGDLALHPLWGLPILMAVLYAAYQFVGVLGAGVAVDFLEESVFNGWLVPGFEWLVRLAAPAGAVEEFLVGPAGASGESGGLLVGRYGLFSMALSYGIAIVLPIVTTFFVFFSLLEDSGYLPRLAVLLNRVFKAMGLNGKAVLPMVLGLGCDTMATMTTRILETRKERIIVTLLLALGVPCSAQLGVILGMLSGLSLSGALWWGGAVALTIVLVGWLAAKVLPGRGSDFLLEVPPIRRPSFSNIAVKTLARIQWYLREALPLFVLGTLVLWLLDRFGLIAGIERLAAPIIEGALGLPREATGAFVIGFLRRDYGAAGLFALFHPAMQAGPLAREVEIQLVVSMVTITLFIPCIANLFVIVKERGWRTGLGIAGFVFPFAIGVGALVNLGMRAF